MRKMYATLYLNAKDVLYVLDKIKKEGLNSLTFYERWVKKHYDRFLIEQPEDLRRIIDKEKAKQQRRANQPPQAGRQESDSDSDSDSDSGSDSDPDYHAGPVANVQPPTSRGRHLPPIRQNASHQNVRDTMSSQSIAHEVNAVQPVPTIIVTQYTTPNNMGASQQNT